MQTTSGVSEWNFPCVGATTNYVHSGTAGAYDTDYTRCLTLKWTVN